MQATEAQGGDKQNGEKQRRTHHRSPAYPMLNLEEALDKAKLIYNGDKRSFTSRPVIVKHLGYKDENSGIGNRELSALRQYGLLEEKGGEYRISDVAYAILFLSADSPERAEALSQAALGPTVFKELWSKYHLDASDGTLKDFLIHKKEFNPASVDQVVANYKTTILFAKLTDVSYAEEEEGKEVEAKVGDYVQLESQGVLQFAEPKRIREISNDGQWAFLEGSNTGVLVKQLTAVDPPTGAPPAPPAPPVSAPPSPRVSVEEKQRFAPPPPIGSGTRQDVFSLSEGQVTIQWPSALSPESFQDLSAWLDILKRKIGRSLATSTKVLLIDKTRDGYVVMPLGGERSARFAAGLRGVASESELRSLLKEEGASEVDIQESVAKLTLQKSWTITIQ